MASSSLVSTRLFALALAGCAFSLATRAHADTLIIRHAGDHSRYSFEAEPHLLLGLIDPPGPADGTGLGIGFGADWVHYGGGREVCVTDSGPSHVTACNKTDSVSALWFPVVMQWNF